MARLSRCPSVNDNELGAPPLSARLLDLAIQNIWGHVDTIIWGH